VWIILLPGRLFVVISRKNWMSSERGPPDLISFYLVPRSCIALEWLLYFDVISAFLLNSHLSRL
jgi:hypothetical protein